MVKRVGLLILCLGALCAGLTQAQPKERTIEEIKTESLARAQRGAYPLGGLDPKDVALALSHIQTLDRDEWAAGWGKVAQTYIDQAQAAKSTAEASAAYKKAWRLYYFAQWPVPNSVGKQGAYDKAIDAYLKHAQVLDPPMEVVKIPFEGKTITVTAHRDEDGDMLADTFPKVKKASGGKDKKKDKAKKDKKKSGKKK